MQVWESLLQKPQPCFGGMVWTPVLGGKRRNGGVGQIPRKQSEDVDWILWNKSRGASTPVAAVSVTLSEWSSWRCRDGWWKKLELWQKEGAAPFAYSVLCFPKIQDSNFQSEQFAAFRRSKELSPSG
ncbi:hypothetical protein CRENBAI_019325 [Crenichthys baileyi]|uniref:Uncharacterized protein n=1 Tax=Crenichthys baileyi TaxID=28760 RepID=A0AAV9QSY3_9TELE